MKEAHSLQLAKTVFIDIDAEPEDVEELEVVPLPDVNYQPPPPIIEQLFTDYFEGRRSSESTENRQEETGDLSPSSQIQPFNDNRD